MRHASSTLTAALPILLLVAHAGTLAMAHDRAMELSFAWLILAPIAAAGTCFYRVFTRSAEGWLPMGAAMLCWAGGMATTMVATLFLEITSEDRLSMLLYVLYGVPLIFALASPEDERWPVRLLDAAMAAALGYLFYEYVSHLSTMAGTQSKNLAALQLMFDIENGYIAVLACLRYLADRGRRQGFFLSAMGYALAYMACAAYINHFEAASQYGGWPDLVIDLPFLLLIWLALTSRGAQVDGSAARPRPFARVVRAGSPLAIPLTLLTVSVLLASFDTRMAIAGCIAASVGYGLRTVLMQLQSFAEHDELQHLSHVDALTGIPNRRRFDEVLQREWARRDDRPGRLALLMIDIDHFKELNDRFGHSVGDERLRSVALALAECVRRDIDLIARHGGEEFAAILTDVDPHGAAAIAERMRTSVEGLSLPSGRDPGVVTVSIGVACAHVVDGDLRDFAAQADAALYDAKRNGRNQVVQSAPCLRVVSSGASARDGRAA
jgi:diguanylate cyclase (GGDEF)-like protein